MARMQKLVFCLSVMRRGGGGGGGQWRIQDPSDVGGAGLNFSKPCSQRGLVSPPRGGPGVSAQVWSPIPQLCEKCSPAHTCKYTLATCLFVCLFVFTVLCRWRHSCPRQCCSRCQLAVEQLSGWHANTSSEWHDIVQSQPSSPVLARRHAGPQSENTSKLETSNYHCPSAVCLQLPYWSCDLYVRPKYDDMMVRLHNIMAA